MLLMIPALIGGCVDSSQDRVVASQDRVVAPFGDMPLGLYVPEYPGSGDWPDGSAHRWLAVIGNPTGAAIEYGVGQKPWLGDFGPVLDDGWAVRAPEDLHIKDGSYATVRDVLQPGERRVWVFDAGRDAFHGDAGAALVAFNDGDVVALRDVIHNVTRGPETTAVAAGDHVQTATVGFWTNGTSFYTNIRALNDDPAFPAGYDRTVFSPLPLPVYVYGDDRTEQPIGSRDSCHFTTIDGYNALLKTQATGSTGVRFLAPEEGYTRPGNEGHALYGDALVFMNTIVAHDGATGPADMLPDPEGDCFDDQNTLDYVGERAPV